jgi:hypothetical protein
MRRLLRAVLRAEESPLLLETRWFLWALLWSRQVGFILLLQRLRMR